MRLPRSPLRMPGVRQQPDARPPVNYYREFDVKDPATNDYPAIASGATFYRNRTALRAPQTYYRATGIAVRNLSVYAVRVKIPGRPEVVVPPSTTDIINSGNTFIDEYEVRADGEINAGEVLLVERCRSWTGWTKQAQEV